MKIKTPRPRDPDPRVTCGRCVHYRPERHQCENHRPAGLWSAEVSPALAALLQHCHGFARGPSA